MKNAVFWNVIRHVALIRSDVSEEHVSSIITVTRCISSQRTSVLVIVNVVPSSPILFTLMTGGIWSSETSALINSQASQHLSRQY
jgi:hypothetical protein